MMTKNILKTIRRIFARTLLFLFFLECILRANGLLHLAVEQYGNKFKSGQPEVYKIVTLGESISWYGGFKSYPRLLEKELNKRSQKTKYQVINQSIPAADTADIVAGMKNITEIYEPDMVIVMMGVNDTDSTLVYDDTAVTRVKLFCQNIRVAKLMQQVFLDLRLWWIAKLNRLAHGQPLDFHADETVEVKGLLQEIRLHPDDGELYEALGRIYEDRGDVGKAADVYRQGLVIKPKKSWGYVELGRLYTRQGEYEQLKKLFGKAIRLNPTKPWAYDEFSKCLVQLGRLDEARQVLEQSVARTPDKYESPLFMGEFYKNNGEWDKAAANFKRAIELNAQDRRAFIHIGECYLKLGEKAAALSAFQNISRYDSKAYQEAADVYIRMNEFEPAESFIKEAMGEQPDLKELNNVLGNIYRAWGKEDLAQKYFTEVKERSEVYYRPATIKNYQTLTGYFLGTGTMLVCVQYPMQDVRPLSDALQGYPVHAFVDNQSSFQKGVDAEGYQAYFKDDFGGNFGHGTEKGNQLLAENVATAVLRLME